MGIFACICATSSRSRKSSALGTYCQTTNWNIIRARRTLLVDIPLFLEYLEPFLKLKRMRPPFVCAIGWLERNRLVTDFEEGKLGLEIEDVSCYEPGVRRSVSQQQIMWTHTQSIVLLVYVSELRMPGAGTVSEDKNKTCVRTIAKRMTVDGSADMRDNGTLNTRRIFKSGIRLTLEVVVHRKEKRTTTKSIGLFLPLHLCLEFGLMSQVSMLNSTCDEEISASLEGTRTTCFFFASSLESHSISFARDH